jgi:23S rRNA pseudouridine1911/1915/1917 synthase
MTREIRLVVSEDVLPDRLDHFLGAHAPDLSRTRAKEIIVEGLVRLNGAAAKPSTQLAAGDVVEASVPELAELRARPESIPLAVCHEDDDIIVVDKVAGMVVHPAPGSTSGTLVNALLGRGAELSRLSGDLRPGIVHRLDRNTSGLIVVAKTEPAHRRLAEAFQEREVEKVYLALVWGRMRDSEGRIEAPIGRRRSDRKKMAVVPDGREAVTAWRLREESPFASLLEVRPETGRTHQIRVHLAHVHRPVLGDDAYGGVKRSFADVPPHYRAQARRVSKLARRQALHARKLAFDHPTTGNRLSFVSPMPDDLAELLSAMRFPEGEVGRVVGVDPGEARTGIAVSDESRMLASSSETLEGLDDAGAASRIAEVARDRGARTIVIGHPVRMDGSLGHRAVRARELAVAVEDAVRARVVLWDERLSSAEAERVLRETGERRRGRKGRVDQVAASVILQGYLDAQRSRQAAASDGPPESNE